MVGHDAPVGCWVLENVATLEIRAERALASEAKRESQKKREVYYRVGD